MRGVTFILAAGCLVQASCSLLFSEGEGTSLDSDAASEDASGRDASSSSCAEPTPLGFEGELLEIERGAVLDLNRDGVDEVVLFSTADSGARAYVTDGSCRRDAVWNYQHEWSHGLEDGGAFVPHGITLVEGRQESNRVAAIGMGADGPALATFELQDAVIGDTALTFDLIPDYASNLTCVSPVAPLFIHAGNFDDDMDPTQNDVVFSAKQGWFYRVERWTTAPSWDATCELNLEQGDIPDQYGGPTTRVGFVPVTSEAGLLDEFVDAHELRLDWRFAGGTESRQRFWPDNAEVDGVATAVSGIPGDERADMVGWVDGATTFFYPVLLTNFSGERNLQFDFVEAEGMPNPIRAGRLLDVAESQYLVLLGGTRLLVLGANGKPLVSLGEVALDFEPAFLLTPNWGPNGARQILVFSPDDASYQCFELSEGIPALQPCSR